MKPKNKFERIGLRTLPDEVPSTSSNKNLTLKP
jgi:hypothetical protein